MAVFKKPAADVAASAAVSDETNQIPLAGTDFKPRGSRDATRFERASRNISKYRAWKQDNMRAYHMLEEIAVERAKSGGRVSGDELTHWLRSHDVADDAGRPCRPNNDYSPLLIRDIAHRHPEVAGHIETRTDVDDALGFPGGDR